MDVDRAVNWRLAQIVDEAMRDHEAEQLSLRELIIDMLLTLRALQEEEP